MTDFQIIPADRHHCREIVNLIRSEERELTLTLGLDPLRLYEDAFDNTAHPKAWMIDGDLAAIGGVSGPLLSVFGFIWLALAARASKYRIAIVKEARHQIEMARAERRILITSLTPGDIKAERLAYFLGFEIIEGHFHRGMQIARHCSYYVEAA